ncbi:MAG: prepilin-type N-terminal cleavage/methylation domain-containing protein [Proteobacteria bacterium]|nr:prepilin-type N-terminal cleavage/methylation domain-containing protein [Pseudomonadota bacterium]MBU1639617.1 prepilin-type N-terminal cleavage/methylation domain-containing protein [Pseudomonadota bacterium]
MMPKKIMDTRAGLSLLEVMVALLLLTVASTMIYSMLDRSLFFADKGEGKSQEIEEHYALVSLLQRQVQSGWLNPATKKVLISGEQDCLRLATAIPFQARAGQVVMAFYRYNPDDNTLYYLEKKDFYNTEYTELVPEYSEMTALVTVSRGLRLDFDEESNTVTLRYGTQSYAFRPWCAAPTAEEVAGG